jgi:hypothetical protein
MSAEVEKTIRRISRILATCPPRAGVRLEYMPIRPATNHEYHTAKTDPSQRPIATRKSDAIYIRSRYARSVQDRTGEESQCC